MSTRDSIVMGASSGGVEALRKIVRELPADFPASVFVVLHIAADSASMLPEILSRGGRLRARHPEDGEEFEPGTIYVAPTDRHMLITRGAIRLDKGSRENGHRPAIDPLFTSESRGLHAVARGFRERVRKARISAKLLEDLLLEHREGSQGTGRAKEDDAEPARSRAPGRAHAGRSPGREDIP